MALRALEIPDGTCDCEVCKVRRVLVAALEKDSHENKREAGDVVRALAQMAGVLIAGAPTSKMKIELFTTLIDTAAEYGGATIEVESSDEGVELRGTGTLN